MIFMPLRRRVTLPVGMGLMIRGGAAAAVGVIDALARCAAATTRQSCKRFLPAMVAALAIVGIPALDASADPTCKPRRPRPVINLTSMGPCAFDSDRLSYFGDPAIQAACLLRALDRSRNLVAAAADVPAALAARVGRSAGLPTRDALLALLLKLDLAHDFAATLWQPVSHARDNDPAAPAARYFVIHDTSGPNYGSRAFPADMDESPKINNLRNFWCADGWAKSHVVVNRGGGMMVGHDFEIPWRETKFERAPRFEGALKGLFLHVELIQPRRRAPGFGRRNDAQAPTPGFTAAQYDRLALLYVIASVRAGAWMVPAFHAPIDADIRGGHDDPQNFDLQVFARSLEDVLQALRSEEILAASAE
jgi:hypothetical protein